MTTLQRQDLSISLPTPMWSEILLFLAKCGWDPGGPMHSLLASEHVVPDAVAASLAAAGEVILDESLNDPAGMVASIRFDLGKFAEVVTFAAEGGFTIRNERDPR